MNKNLFLIHNYGFILLVFIIFSCSKTDPPEKHYFTSLETKEADAVLTISNSIPIGKKPHLSENGPENLSKALDFLLESFSQMISLDFEDDSFISGFEKALEQCNMFFEQLKDEHNVNSLKRSGNKSIIDGLTLLKFNGSFEADFIGLKVDGHHIVVKNNQYGLINEKGEVVIPIEYDMIDVPSEGKVSAKKEGKWGYLNLEGKIEIPFHFEDAQMFIDGYAHVVSNTIEGVIDSVGNWVSDPSKDNNWMSQYITSQNRNQYVEVGYYSGSYYFWCLKNSVNDKYNFVLFDDKFNAWKYKSKGIGKDRVPFTKVRNYYILYNSVVIDEKGRYVNILEQDYPIDNQFDGYGICSSINATYLVAPQGKTDIIKASFNKVYKNYLVLHDVEEVHFFYDILSKNTLQTSKGLEYLNEKCYWVKNEKGFSCYSYDEEKIMDVDDFKATDFSFDLYEKNNLKGLFSKEYYTNAVFDDVQIFDEHIFLKKNRKWAVCNSDLEPYSNYDYAFIEKINRYTFKLFKTISQYHIIQDTILISDLFHDSRYDSTFIRKTAIKNLYLTSIPEYNLWGRPDIYNKFYGYINNEGELTIPYQFNDAKEFVNGTAIVKGKIDEKAESLYGVINSEGDYIIPPKYELGKIERVGDSYFVVNKNKNFTLYNDEGDKIEMFEDYSCIHAKNIIDEVFFLRKAKDHIMMYDCKTNQRKILTKEWFDENNLEFYFLGDNEYRKDKNSSIYKLKGQIDNSLSYLKKHKVEYTLVDSTITKAYYSDNIRYRIQTEKQIPAIIIQNNYFSYEKTKDGFFYEIDQSINTVEYYDLKRQEKLTFDGVFVSATDDYNSFECIGDDYKKGIYNMKDQKWSIEPIYDDIQTYRSSELLYLRKGDKVFYANSKGNITNFGDHVAQNSRGYLISDRFIYFKNNNDSIYDLVEKSYMKIPALEGVPDLIYINNDLIMLSDNHFYNLDKGLHKDLFSDKNIISDTSAFKLEFDYQQYKNENIKGLIFEVKGKRNQYYGILDEYGKVIIKPQYHYILPLTSEFTYGFKGEIYNNQIETFKLSTNKPEKIIEKQDSEYYLALDQYKSVKG